MPLLNEFEQKAQDWLDAPKAKRDIQVGATLMLQANRNRILYKNVLHKENFEKVEYELKKYMDANCTGVGVAAPTVNVTAKEVEVFKLAEKAERDGKRADHDTLPAEIQQLVDLNLEKYHIMRSVHEKLKVFSGEKYSPKDRLPLLDQLLELDSTITANWEAYDAWKQGDAIPGQKDNIYKKAESLSIQRVNSNRTYLSRAANEVPQKRKAGKNEQADKQAYEASIRYAELIADGQQVDPNIIQKLTDAGIIKAE